MAQINTHKLDASKIDLKIPSKLIERGSTLSKATA
jgi:LacI family transcriptional regulator